ncbi:MAG: GNAT family N-acetyltransferase [Tateyamaria sp.]|jgi:ribosomal-protein-alanine N-acetyltransferase|uniref:GNAT family N-acetyltransferase n=1 Tax=Tateyamaria sp. TaxID=1929288 RepID=UPI0032DC4B47
MTPEALAKLHDAAFSKDRAWSADEFRALLDSPYCHLSTAQNGFALWRAIAGEAELLTIATHPDHQRQGIGTELMQQWMRTAQDSAGTAFLEVAADNAPATRLYAQFGFEVVSRRAGYYKRDDHKVEALIMRAPLPFTVSQKSSGD